MSVIINGLDQVSLDMPHTKLWEYNSTTAALTNTAGTARRNMAFGLISVGSRDMEAVSYPLDGYYEETMTDNSTRHGVYMIHGGAKTSAQYTGYLASGYFEGRVLATNTQNWTQGIYGVKSEISAFGTNGVTAGTIAYGIAHLMTFDLKQYSSAFTNLYGLKVNAPAYGSGVSPTNFYGIYIEAPTGAATINRAIHVAGGDTYFGGIVTYGVGIALQWKNNAGTASDVLVGYNAELDLYSPFGPLNMLYNNAYDINIWGGGGTAGSAQVLLLGGSVSTSGAVKKNSPTINLRANHWNGANTTRDLTIQHTMITEGATPVSDVVLTHAGVPILTLRNSNGTVLIIPNGLPTSDPSVSGALYQVAATHVMMVSA
jgi:hypothetical protein